MLAHPAGFHTLELAQGSINPASSLSHLSMKRLILVDVCNVAHAVSTYRNRIGEGWDTLAGELLDFLAPLHDLEAWEIHLVVDGQGSRLDQQFPTDSRTLSIIYSPSGQSADTIIESWLLRLDPGWQLRVATGDRAIIHSALGKGAEVFSPTELMEWVTRVRERESRRLETLRKKSSNDFGNRLEGLS